MPEPASKEATPAKPKPPAKKPARRKQPAATEKPAKAQPSTTKDKPKKRATKQKVNRQKNDAFGRPTKYDPKYNEIAKELCLLGKTDEQIAEAFGVHFNTINIWKKKHPLFKVSIMDGREFADGRVAKSLYHRAIGYEHDDVHVSAYQGDVTLTPIRKHYPPDTQAASLWLRNRQPKLWRDKTEINHEVNGVVEVRNIAEIDRRQLMELAAIDVDVKEIEG